MRTETTCKTMKVRWSHSVSDTFRSLTLGGHDFVGRHVHLAADLSAPASLYYYYRTRPLGTPSFDLCLGREVRLAQGALVPASEWARQFGEQVSRRRRRRLSSFGGEDEAEEQQHDDYYDDNEDEQEAGGRGYDEAGDSVEEEEEEEDEEEEEEAVRAVLGAKKTTTASSSAAKKQSRKSVASTSGRRRSSPDYRRDASLDAEDEEEEEASPSGLMKLDRNGRPVPADRPKNKGKGRASDLNGSPAEGGRGRQREVDVFEQQEEEVVQQEYVEQDDYYQDEFGGGGDDEEGEGQYDPHDYGDAAGGDDDFDSAGEDGDGPSRHDVDVQEVDEDGNPISDQDEQMQGPSSRPYAAKNKGKGKGKGKAKPKPRTQSESPQRRSTAGNRSRQKQSQQPVITEISRKRAREAGTVDIDGGESFRAPSTAS